MAGLLDYYFNPYSDPNKPRGLLDAADEDSAKRAGLWNGLGTLANYLAEAGRPRTTPGGVFGPALASGGAAMLSGTQDARNAAVKEKIVGQQFSMNQRQMQREDDKQAAQTRFAGHFGFPTTGGGTQVADASGMIGAPPSPVKFDLASVMQRPGAYEDYIKAGGDPVRLMESMQKKKERIKLGQGDQVRDEDGNLIAENPAAPKAPPTRDRYEGGTIIQEQMRPDGTWEQIGKGQRWQPQQGDPNAGFNKVSTLRKEFQARPEVQAWQTVQPIMASIEEAAGRDTRAADLNLTYGLSKIMDPNSVVREGEQIMVQKTAALPAWLMGEIKRINGGASLRPETRQAILAEARSRTQFAYGQAKSIADQYTDYATRTGLPPQDVVFGLSPATAGNQPKRTGQQQAPNVPAPPPGFTVLD